MAILPIDKLIAKTNSIFKLVILISKRTLELAGGAVPLTDKSSLDTKLQDTALREILEDKISIKVKEEK